MGWGPPTLGVGAALLVPTGFNVILIQKHPHRNIQKKAGSKTGLLWPSQGDTEKEPSGFPNHLSWQFPEQARSCLVFPPWLIRPLFCFVFSSSQISFPPLFTLACTSLHYCSQLSSNVPSFSPRPISAFPCHRESRLLYPTQEHPLHKTDRWALGRDSWPPTLTQTCWNAAWHSLRDVFSVPGLGRPGHRCSVGSCWINSWPFRRTEMMSFSHEQWKVSRLELGSSAVFPLLKWSFPGRHSALACRGNVGMARRRGLAELNSHGGAWGVR